MQDPGGTSETQAWTAEFEAAARRPLRSRLRYAFIHTYKPVLDDERYRSFDSMADYRAWLPVHRKVRSDPARIALTDAQADEIRRGKDFVQLKNGLTDAHATVMNSGRPS